MFLVVVLQKQVMIQPRHGKKQEFKWYRSTFKIWSWVHEFRKMQHKAQRL